MAQSKQGEHVSLKTAENARLFIPWPLHRDNLFRFQALHLWKSSQRKSGIVSVGPDCRRGLGRSAAASSGNSFVLPCGHAKPCAWNHRDPAGETGAASCATTKRWNSETERPAGILIVYHSPFLQSRRHTTHPFGAELDGRDLAAQLFRSRNSRW